MSEGSLGATVIYLTSRMLRWAWYFVMDESGIPGNTLSLSHLSGTTSGESGVPDNRMMGIIFSFSIFRFFNLTAVF